MSVDMYVSASKNQAKSVSGMTKQQTTGYEELQKAIADFTLNSPFLTGKAYDTSKAFFSTVLYPLAQGGILLSEAVDKAVTKFPQDYQSQVDSGNLKQSDLEEKIRQANRLIGQAEGIRTMLESSLTPDIIKSSQLAANLRLLESYSGVKRILEEKLDKLMTFNHNSPRIFEEIQALEDAIDKGLAQTETSFNPDTGIFTIPPKEAMGWSKTITEKWLARDEDEQQRLKEKLEKENFPTTKAEILRDYHWSTNSNMYVNNKTGIPSPEVTGLYNMFVQAEHTSQKNPQLEFFNEMLRTGKHPTTGVKITEAERANAVLMLYTLALQPFVGAWAMSKIPQSAESVSEVKKTESNINWEAKQPVSGEQWNSYFKEKYGPGNVERKIYFKDTGALESHFNKHNGEMKKAMGLSNYSLETYLNDANYVINNGTYVPEMNGYVKLIGGEGSAKYAFIGLDRKTGEITTYHVKTVGELIKKAPSLNLEK